jgi:hypothetical protein
VQAEVTSVLSPATWKRSLDERLIDFPFHEAVIGANSQRISLVFSDLTVHPVDSGYTPFIVNDERGLPHGWSSDSSSNLKATAFAERFAGALRCEFLGQCGTEYRDLIPEAAGEHSR